MSRAATLKTPSALEKPALIVLPTPKQRKAQIIGDAHLPAVPNEPATWEEAIHRLRLAYHILDCLGEAVTNDTLTKKQGRWWPEEVRAALAGEATTKTAATRVKWSGKKAIDATRPAGRDAGDEARGREQGR